MKKEDKTNVMRVLDGKKIKTLSRNRPWIRSISKNRFNYRYIVWYAMVIELLRKRE